MRERERATELHLQERMCFAVYMCEKTSAVIKEWRVRAIVCLWTSIKAVEKLMQTFVESLALRENSLHNTNQKKM